MPLVNDLPPTIKIRSESKVRIERLSSESDSSQAKFPRIEECAHFHYDSVDHGSIKLSFAKESFKKSHSNRSSLTDEFNYTYCVRVTAKNKCWVVKRNLLHFLTLDQLLHECVYDRKYSLLPILKSEDLKPLPHAEIHSILCSYLARLSEITDSNVDGGQIFCAPVLHWFEVDSQGRTLVSHALGDVADINIPAVAAARVVRRYQAVADDELTLNVGDMVSIIEMPPTGWWRGKQGLKVGSFPSQCVKRISSPTDVVGTHQRPFVPPQYVSPSKQIPISKKHGKIMVVLRSFLDTRPTKSALKKKGILRERVFGCDLGELLHRIGEEVPTVVSDCTRFVEKYGVIDGIYRISGVASHIRHLKYEFDSDRRPNLESKLDGLPELSTSAARRSEDNNTMCDPHSVAGLCKLFFRELPNPLLTYQLYNRFASAVSDYEAEERLLKVHDAIQQLPPPHYRTLKHLISHLQYMAQRDRTTSMHCRNLAIVWAPNLLRSRDIEAGLAAFTEARVQSVVIEFLIANADLLFSEELQTKQYDAENKPPRPRSLMLVPANKLISLEEAQARSKSGIVSPILDKLSPQGGVRMRDWTEKSTSERRKRRQKKSTSTNIVLRSESPRTPRSKKISHRHTHSVQDANFSFSKTGDILFDSPSSPIKATSPIGWKEKLGNFLKKTQSHPPVPKQASLRRTKSDDSLFSSSSQKLRDSATKKRRPKSLYAERNHSDPHVTFFREDLSSSPVRSRKKSAQKKTSSPAKRRAKRTESNPVDNQRRDTFQVTFRKLGHRNTVQGSGVSLLPEKKLTFDSLNPASPDRVPSPSPFFDLSSDFPNVMGEGLDFDPLNFRSGRHSEPSWQDIVVPPYKPVEEITHKPPISSSSSAAIKHDPKRSSAASKVSVSVKRVESVRSARGEPVFAAVSSFASASKSKSVPLQEAGRRSDLDCVTMNSLDAKPSPSNMLQEITVSTSKLSLANQSANNNILLRENSEAVPLNDATAERILHVPRSSKEKLSVTKKVKSKRKSSRKSSTEWSSTRYSFGSSDECLDESSKNGDTSQTKEMQQEEMGLNYTVQVCNFPSKSSPRKNANHHGSFIALVGANNDSPTTTTPLSARETNISPISPLVADPTRKQMRNSYKKENFNRLPFKMGETRQMPKRFSFAPKGSEYLQEAACSSRLETFNPDGRTREGYQELNLSPRYPNNQRDQPRTRSCDSSPVRLCDRLPISINSCASSSCENDATYRSHPQNNEKSLEKIIPARRKHSLLNRPKPAPRQHFRSYSAGDCLDRPNSNSTPLQQAQPLVRTVRKQGSETHREEKQGRSIQFTSEDSPSTEKIKPMLSKVQYAEEVEINLNFDDQRPKPELDNIYVDDYSVFQTAY